MSFLEAFLNVLAILGLIVAGGFLVFLLGNLLLSILEPRHKKLQEKDDYEEKVSSKEIENVKEQTFQLEDTNTLTSADAKSEIVEEKFVLEEEKPNAVDFDSAEAEKNSLGVTSAETKTEKPSDDLNSLFNDNDGFNFGDDDDFDFDKLFADEPATKPEGAPAEVMPTHESETTDFVNGIVENNAPITTAVAPSREVSETVKEIYNNNQTTTHTEKQVFVGNPEVENQLRTEIELLRQELENQKLLYEELRSQAKLNEQKWEQEKTNLEKLYTQAEVHEEEKSVPLLTLEEYESRLEVLRERLKVNEKELKLNKKEFIPLKRVRKNLDKDKDKLRRREALVAKQKVMLYGVNNITEIDQEKAKKLAEDLDLLDGLKVSVRHCEEVMEANKDRYPILETANRILNTTHKELKDDIAECEKAIFELKKANGVSDTDGAVITMTSETAEIVNATESAPKRRRGRPRKTEVLEEKTETNHETIEKLNDIIGANEEIEAPVVNQVAKTEEELDINSIFGIEEEPVVEVKKEEKISPAHEKLFEYTEENQKKSVKVSEHKFNFEEEEPSFEDLFAIETENDNKKK